MAAGTHSNTTMDAAFRHTQLPFIIHMAVVGPANTCVIWDRATPPIGVVLLTAFDGDIQPHPAVEQGLES